MSIKVEVKGARADRFRAYSAAGMTRALSVADHIARDRAGLPPLPKGASIQYEVEQIAFEGEVSGDTIRLDAGETVVKRVVLYIGPVEEEVVAGSVEVNTAGVIELKLVDPVESNLG